MTDENTNKQPLSQGKMIESLENQIATLRRDYSKIESVNRTLADENNELWKAFKVRSQENKELRKELEKEWQVFISSPEFKQQARGDTTAPDAATAPTVDDLSLAPALGAAAFITGLASLFKRKRKETVAKTVQALETVDQQIDAVVAHAEHRVAA